MSARSRDSAPADGEIRVARQILYRFASLCLADPRSGTWGQIADADTRRIALAAAARLKSEAGGRRRAGTMDKRPAALLDPGAVLERLPASAELFEETFLRLFGPLVRGACPVHETDYMGERLDFQRAQALADVSGYYRAFGLRPSARHPERPDHVALELEFMAVLLDLERRATESGPDGAGRAELCRDAQRRFFQEHLAWWVPACCRMLAREAGAGFHGALALFVDALIAGERILLGVPAREREAEPAPHDTSAECGGCLEPC